MFCGLSLRGSLVSSSTVSSPARDLSLLSVPLITWDMCQFFFIIFRLMSCLILMEQNDDFQSDVWLS